MTYDLSPSEAAAHLGVSLATLKRWALAGKVPGWKQPGGYWKFSAEELTAWRDSQRVRPTEPAA